MLQRLIAIGSASALNVALVAVLSLLLAKVLTPEDFGIVRTITAYAIILTMLGNFTIHDALAFFIANSKKEEIKSLFFHASIMTGAFSVATAVCASLVFYSFDIWQGNLRSTLIFISSISPILCLTIVYSNSLQALGSHRTFVIVTIISALIPLVFIFPMSYAWGLDGWVAGRLVSALVLLFATYFFLREHISLCKLNSEYILKIWSFARVQFVSGALSLVLMSVDIVYLEYATHNLPMVANYGLAQLFAKAPLFLASTISRSYFKDLASTNPSYKNKISDFMIMNALVATLVALSVNLICPIIITHIYGPEYEMSKSVLRVMSFGVFFNFLWNAIYTITLAQGKPAIAVKVSTTGAVTGAVLLYFLISRYEAVGAAWAMNIAYAAGVLVGLYLIVKSDFFQKPGLQHG